MNDPKGQSAYPSTDVSNDLATSGWIYAQMASNDGDPWRDYLEAVYEDSSVGMNLNTEILMSYLQSEAWNNNLVRVSIPTHLL